MAQTKVKLIADGVIVQSNLNASHGITTADIGENASYLYYTDARVSNYLSTNGYDTATNIIASITDSAPSTLDTLNELAAALGDDANFSTTVTNSIATKMPLAGGTFTGAVVGTSFSAPSGFINGSNGGIRIHSSGTKFFNITGANAARDGIMDIGASDARFKDLYLSGNITAGNATFAGNVTIGTGIIKPNIGGDIAITQGAIGLRINDAASAISPTTATSNNDNAVDLGVSNIRFRNLYIGGTGTFGDYIDAGGRIKVSGGNTDQYYFEGARNGVGVTYRLYDNANNIYHDSYSSQVIRVNQIGGSGGGFFFSGGDFNLTTTNVHINGGTSYNDKSNLYLSNGRSLIQSDIVDQTANGDTSLDFQTRKNGSLASAMFIDEFRNVGIGLTNPQFGLSMAQGTGDGSRIGWNDGGGDKRASIICSSSTDALQFHTGTSDTERMRITSGGDVNIFNNSSYTRINVDNKKGSAGGTSAIQFGLSDGTFVTTDAARIESRIIANPNAAMDFKVYGSGLNTIMSLLGTGNVGIGTTSPQQLLHISNTSGDFGAEAVLRGSTSTGTPKSEIAFKRGSSGDGAEMVLRTSNSSGTIQDVMTLDTSGNVGIGSDTPLYLYSEQDIGQIAVNRVPSNGFITDTSRSAAYINLNASNGGSSLTFHTANANNLAPTERMRITSGGNILAGKTVTGQVLTDGFEYSTDNYLSICNSVSSNYSLYVANKGTSGTRNMVAFYGTSSIVGSITHNGTVTAYNTTSDYRLKEDLKDFAGLDMVSKIPVYDFKWKSDENRSYGVMAHELQEVLPDAVSGEKDAEEMQGVDYSKIVPLLVKSIQELKAEIELLKTQING